MNAVSECVRQVVVLLVSRDWVALEQLTSGRRLSAEEVERAVSEYPGTLSMPPDKVLEFLDVVEVGALCLVNRVFGFRFGRLRKVVPTCRWN